jgi:hypothetical protein
MINKYLANSGSHILQPAKSCVLAGTKKMLHILGVGMSFTVSAAPTTYTLNNDDQSTIIAAFDCSPSFSGKAALGENKFAYVWECEHNTDAKYAIYKTSYTSRFNVTLSSEGNAADFFEQYLASKVTSYRQNSRMSNLRHAILHTNYSPDGVAYADYFITYNWDKTDRMAQQGRVIFSNGYIADWSVVSPMESSVAADEFNDYVKYFEIKTQ